MGRDVLCQYGRAVTKERLAALLAEVEGVRLGEDIEHVHRMRVASRRLRSALRIFKECFKGKNGKLWRAEAKNVTNSLGEARDLDVQIVYLTDLGSRWGEEDGGLQAVIAHLRERRGGLQPSIEKLMERLGNESPLLSLRAELEKEAGPEGPLAILRPHAFAHATMAVEELFDHASSVPVYEDWQGHHALRIAGKHLRYSLETFRSVYDDGLNEELRAMKRLQDAVGELHDCDVWLQRIPDLRNDIASAAEALDRLQDDLQGRRRELHSKLVETWSELEQDRYFHRLLVKLRGGEGGDVCPVRVALISDVHGNASALRAVLADAREQGATAFLNAGDTVGPPRTEETIGLLRGADLLSVRGNLDQAALDMRAGKRVNDRNVEMATEGLSPQSWEWISSLPVEVRLDICGRTLLMVHAAPGSLSEKLLPETPDSRLRGIAQKEKVDVIVTGHTHVPMVRNAPRTLLINPGSVGRPREGPEASYATLDLPSLEVTHRSVAYDFRGTAEEVRAAGLSDLAMDIEEGRKEDRVAEVGRWAESMCHDTDHLQQVRTLALLLFDRTRGLHRLSSEDRELLEMAALAHDVGLAEGAEGHQRRALDIVMNANISLGRRDRMIVACISRYHGCSAPKEGDRVFRDLGKADRKRVRKLASILALADALDRGHDSRVSGLEVLVSKKEVLLQLSGRGPFTLEMEWVAYKQCQFEKVFGRRVGIDK